MRKQFTALLLSLALYGCGDGYTHVGPNGVDAVPRLASVLGPSIHLDPGTKLTPVEEVSDNAWAYEIKDGKYQGNVVVIQNRDLNP